METTAKRVEPFRGKVNVMFRGAVLASTDVALKLSEPGQRDLYFIPYGHIAFEFLQEEPRTGEAREPLLRYWRLSAVGEAADKALRAFDAPPVELGTLRDHAAFDPGIVTVEAMETPDPEHKVHWPD